MDLSGVGWVYERESTEIRAQGTTYHYTLEQGSNVGHLLIQLAPALVVEVARRGVELVVMTQVNLGIPFTIKNVSPLEVQVTGPPFEEKRF